MTRDKKGWQPGDGLGVLFCAVSSLSSSNILGGEDCLQKAKVNRPKLGVVWPTFLRSRNSYAFLQERKRHININKIFR